MREARETDVARGHAGLLFQQALCRLGRSRCKVPSPGGVTSCDCKIATERPQDYSARPCVAWHVALKARRLSIGVASSSRRLRPEAAKAQCARLWSVLCGDSHARRREVA